MTIERYNKTISRFPLMTTAFVGTLLRSWEAFQVIMPGTVSIILLAVLPGVIIVGAEVYFISYYYSKSRVASHTMKAPHVHSRYYQALALFTLLHVALGIFLVRLPN